MVELGRSREWLHTADDQDVEAARWHLYAGRLAGHATEPYRRRREIAEIELIEDSKTRARKTAEFEKRRVRELKAAEAAQVEFRRVLLLDEDDDDG